MVSVSTPGSLRTRSVLHSAIRGERPMRKISGLRRRLYSSGRESISLWARVLISCRLGEGSNLLALSHDRHHQILCRGDSCQAQDQRQVLPRYVGDDVAWLGSLVRGIENVRQSMTPSVKVPDYLLPAGICHLCHVGGELHARSPGSIFLPDRGQLVNTA